MIQLNPKKKLDIEVDGQKWNRYPIKTELILPGSDYCEIYRKALANTDLNVNGEDIVFVGEKAIAIAEHRAFHIDSIKVSPLAKFLVRYVTKTPIGVGISSPQTFQLAIQEAGVIRILLAAVIGGFFKLLKVKGVFYMIAGEQVAMIDGAADYVIPPYNKYCSLGPKYPDASAKKLAAALKTRVTIVDANDFGVRVVGKSDKSLSTEFIKKVLKDNVLGQSDQQTPLGVIRLVK